MRVVAVPGVVQISREHQDGPRRDRAVASFGARPRPRPAPAAGGIEGGGFAPFLSCRYQPKTRLRYSVLVFGETPLSPLLENRGFLPVQIFGPFAEKPHLIGQGRTPESIVWRM